MPRCLLTFRPQKRDAVAKQLLARAAAGKAGHGKIVYRTLRDGDLMLTNRQPTLHKPGMMAHRARVLKAITLTFLWCDIPAAAAGEQVMSEGTI